MKQPEAIYRTIVKEMNCGFALNKLITDNSGKPVDYEFIEINPAFEALTGLKREQVLGKTAKNILPDLDIDLEKRITQYAEVALEGKQIHCREYWPPLKKWFHTSIFRPWKGYFVTIFNDLTNFPEIEENRGHTAHELRTPLNAIIGFSDLLISSLTDTKQTAYAGAIKKAGQNLLELIEKIMGPSKTKTEKPGTQAPEVIPTTDSTPIDKFEFQKSRVLVVDDVRANRFLLQTFLSRTNLEFMEAENGKEAVEMVKNSRPDLILMDIMMPVMDGYEAAKLLKSNPDTRDIPLVALTAASRASERAKINECGFDGYLAKPVELPTLFRQLARFLPHSVQGTSPTPTPSPPPPGPAAIRDLPNLLKSLETEMIPLWEEIKGAVDIEEVETFAGKLEELAQRHAAQDLISYAHSLKEDVESFDIENIEKTLTGFTAVAANLKARVNLPQEKKADV